MNQDKDGITILHWQLMTFVCFLALWIIIAGIRMDFRPPSTAVVEGMVLSALTMTVWIIIRRVFLNWYPPTWWPRNKAST